jgi:nucleoside-diphosphate-sugar epimerase
MICLVTGSAGFIGSHLCEALLEAGHEVHGIDALIPYYSPAVKERNQSSALAHPRFRLHRLDLRTDPLDPLVADAEVVFHLAAMPGLPESWTNFDGYLTCNVLATQRLLDAVHRSGRHLRRFIYASTSSVYGRFSSGDEALPTRPISPYGVTKLAAENLCASYCDSFDLPVVTLRYFSVYGPRQRPDMGYWRFIDALLRGTAVTVYGGGRQVRGNTYVADCVAATVAAMNALPGEVYNVGGGEAATVWDILQKLEQIGGAKFKVREEAARPGDQRYTFADTSKLHRHVGWSAQTSLDDGLKRQWEWQRQLLTAAPRAE